MPFPYTLRSVRAALVLAAVAASPYASAQITVTEADVLAQLTASGTTSSYDLLDTEDFADLQVLADRSGGGQTWDFTAFTWENLVTASYEPVALPVPGSDLFTGISHVIQASLDDSTSFGFFDLDASGHRLLGVTAEIDDGEGGTIVGGLRFDPYDVFIPLPLTSTSEWSEAYEIAFVPAFEGFTVEAEETSAVEGWGTLVTPAGSAPVLKVRTETVTTTTISIIGEPIVETDTSYTVEFISTGGVGASIDLDAEQQVTGATYSTLLVGGGGTAVEAPVPGADFGLRTDGANPVRRGADVEVAFALAAPADVRLEAFDALGRRVATLADGPRGAGPQRASFATAGLPAGVYVVRLGAEGRTAALRVTVAE